MAAFGACYPIFAPFAADETDSAAPTYGEIKVLGELVNANRTVVLASGEVYGDDKIVEQVSEFVSADIPMETVDMLDESAAVVYGATINETTSELEFGADDEPPYGGLAYYKRLKRKGKNYFKGYFYPKAKASLGNDNAATKGSSISFQNAQTPFKIYPPLYSALKWCYNKTFETEAEVKAWARGKLGEVAGG